MRGATVHNNLQCSHQVAPINSVIVLNSHSLKNDTHVQHQQRPLGKTKYIIKGFSVYTSDKGLSLSEINERAELLLYPNYIYSIPPNKGQLPYYMYV